MGWRRKKRGGKGGNSHSKANKLFFFKVIWQNRSSCGEVVSLANRCNTVLEILNLKRFALHNRWQPESMLMFFGSVSDVMVFFFSLKLPSAGGKAVPRKRNQIWMQQVSHSDRGSMPDATGPNRKQPH